MEYKEESMIDRNGKCYICAVVRLTTNTDLSTHLIYEIFHDTESQPCSIHTFYIRTPEERIEKKFLFIYRNSYSRITNFHY